jgi:hypothetical protein
MRASRASRWSASGAKEESNSIAELNILNTSRQEKTKEKKQNLPMKEKQKHRPEAVTASRWSAPKASKI